MAVNYDEYFAEALYLYENDKTLKNSKAGVARFLRKKYNIETSINAVRFAIASRINNHYNKSGLSVDSENTTSPNDYPQEEPLKLSAWNKEGFMMNISEYCEAYKLPEEKIRSYKLISHTGTPYYNIVFNAEEIENEGLDLDKIRAVLNEQLNRVYTYEAKPFKQETEGVLKWADLHFGAHIRNLVLSKDYDSKILEEGLFKSAETVNSLGFKKVHVHINGDLIESFSGLNHINSWLSLDKNEIGPNAVMLCCELLEKALSKIENLGCVKIVAGNHDRTSKNNDEDVKGGAAELIAWGLTLKGFDVEFNPYIITHLVGKINHINLHGDKGISKKSTEDILWKYGTKGVFNFIFEAHLHSLIEKLSASQIKNFKTVTDDAIDHRRMNLQPFFTGNYYSETLGFTSNAGYTIVSDNGKGIPNVFNVSC